MKTATKILTLYLMLFSGFRAATLLVHADDFRSLGTGEIASAFLLGFRYDVSLVFIVAGAPLLLLALPWGRFQRSRWRSVLGWLCFVIFIGFAFQHAADLVYFGFVHRHVGPEVAIADEDLDQTVMLVLTEYPLALAGFVAGAVGAFFSWRRMLRRPESWEVRPWRRPVVVTALLLIVIVGARGRLGVERLNMEQAYESGGVAGGNLALSGPYSALHFATRSPRTDWEFYPFEEALAETTSLIISSEEQVVDPERPLLRKRTATGGVKPNVVVFLLESWSAAAVDLQRGDTPRFESLRREGVYFPRFYASGQRSQNGIAAVVGGFPTLPGVPYLGNGMELMRLTFLGGLAREEGYATWWLQGSKRASQRMHLVAEQAGFDDFVGGEDLEEPNERDGRWLKAWDHVLLQETQRRFLTTKEPFLGFVHTASTHPPFMYPRSEWLHHPSDSMENNYRNALRYADAALGDFFDAARRAPRFTRTIFLITADHTLRLGASEGLDLFHIPCLIIAPGLAPRVDERIGSQVDAIPTIAHLAGWGTPYAAVGRSLFDDEGPAVRGALCRSSHLLYRVEGDGYVADTFERRADAKAFVPGADLDGIQRRLRAISQTAATLLLKNRLR